MELSRDQWIDVNYYKYWDILYQYSCNITRDQATAGDIVQEVYVAIWNNYHKLTIENPKAYLLRAVRNKSLRALTTSTFDTVQLEEAYMALTDNQVLTKEEEVELKEQLLKMIYEKAQEVLPEKCYQIFVLRFYNHLTYREIALKLKISESTVDNQINKALKSIKTTLPYAVDYIVIISYLLNVR
ncbi:MAG: sigma-70 family RNA polymerase sigma factor [Flavobacteriaceae bacterium]|jgi:RNA polymerase sigma-70 factor (ECF subfamily)|nr:sigma-70 family RNA polymerase sigma factor [Flavobacteriaceae bacterium]